MPISFPLTPNVADEYTFANQTWVFNGRGWVPKPAGSTAGTPYTPPNGGAVHFVFSNR